MDLIERDRLKDFFCEHCSAHFLIYKNVDECRKGYCEKMYFTDKIKSVDAVPVVRCKDCVNWGEEFEHELHLCENFGCMKHANEYCSDGKRREETNDGK